MPPDPVSQKEIAGRLGMHQSTVSYILRGERLDRYSEKTRERVLALARELNYRPSRSARVLKGQPSRMIGVLEFDIRGALARRCLHAVCTEIARREYTPLPLDGNWFTLASDSVCDVLIEQRVDGVLLIGFGDDFARTELPRLLAARIPCAVCLGLKIPGIPQMDADRRSAFAEITRRAIEAGAKHPCYLGRPVTTLRQVTRPPWMEARDGFREAAQAAGIRRPSTHWVTHLPERPTDFPASGRAGMRALLSRRRRPDAVICYNDLMAFGALAECLDQGVRVPEDISIYGFGDEDLSPHISPGLSTMRVREEALARQTVDTLFNLIDDPEFPRDAQYFLPSIFDWVPRASSRNPPEKASGEGSDRLEFRQAGSASSARQSGKNPGHRSTIPSRRD